MPAADLPLPAAVAAAKAQLERARRLRDCQGVARAFERVRDERTKALRKEVREMRRRAREARQQKEAAK